MATTKNGVAMPKEQERAERLADDLTRAYGGALVSVVLYGSAARGEYHEGISDLNVLVLLSSTDAATLRLGSDVARGWAVEGNPPPLVLGAEEWRRSADVFPIELADIRDAHRVLRGADPFEGITIEMADLRLQTENELKGKYIRLRQHYLLAAARPEELGALLKQSLSTFLVLFRAVLRLARDDAAARDHEEVIRRTATHVVFDPEPLLGVLRARRSGEKLKPAADAPEVLGYLDAVGRVVEWVDRLPAERRGPADAAGV
jgi:predicted nucleotidyltransferase